MNRVKIAALLGLSALCLTPGCKRSATSAEGQDDSKVIAQVGEQTITSRELQAKLEEQPPFVRSRYSSLEAKKEFLENLIRFEVLAQEARKQGLDQDPEVKATLEKLMVQKLIQKHAATAAAVPPSPEEFQKYYQEHISEFVRPERVRVSQVLLSAASSDPKRPAVKAEAEKLLAEVRRQESGAVKTAFLELVRSRSDDPSTKALDGDLGFKTREELTGLWGAEVAESAFRLQNVGELVHAASDRGLHLLKLTGRQPGFEQKLDAVKPRIESRLLMEKRSRAMDELVTALRAKTEIELDEAALSAVAVEADGTGTARSDKL